MDGVFGAHGVDGVNFWPGGEDPAYPLAWSQEQNGQQYNLHHISVQE
eukprot:COSAG01_NODE_3082_length_6620_cov_24.480754_4_plen_47_part_00